MRIFVLVRQWIWGVAAMSAVVATVAAESGNFDLTMKVVRETGAAGNPEEAIRQLDQVLILAPQLVEAYVLRAELHQATGAKQAALADLDQVLAFKPESSAVRALRARYRFELADYPGAVADLVKTGNPELIELRGQARMALGQYTEALKDFEYLMSGPFGPYLNARFPRAICLMALERVEEAAGWFEAEATDGVSVDARFQLVLCRLLLGKFEEVNRLTLEWAQAAAAPEPTDDYDRRTWQALKERVDDTSYLRGVARFAEQKYSEAVRMLELGSATDDYVRLLRHVALARSKQPDDQLTTQGSCQDAWAEQLRRFLIGDLSEKQLLTAAAAPTDVHERRRRETEACFYAAQQRLVVRADDTLPAELLLEKTVALRKVDVAEYALAKLALVPAKP